MVLVALESFRTMSTVIILWSIGLSLCASHDVCAPYITVELFSSCWNNDDDDDDDDNDGSKKRVQHELHLEIEK